MCCFLLRPYPNPRRAELFNVGTSKLRVCMGCAVISPLPAWETVYGCDYSPSSLLRLQRQNTLRSSSMMTPTLQGWDVAIACHSGRNHCDGGCVFGHPALSVVYNFSPGLTQTMFYAAPLRNSHLSGLQRKDALFQPLIDFLLEQAP